MNTHDSRETLKAAVKQLRATATELEHRIQLSPERVAELDSREALELYLAAVRLDAQSDKLFFIPPWE